MKIVAFSINPLFADQVMGGAPKHLQSIVLHLGELGHDVTVLCTRVSDDQQPFNWHDNVRVLPVLRFKQPFPQPYAAPAYDLAAALQTVGEHLQAADRFYMHDGEFLFPYAYQHIPTVVSLRDNVYPETLQGGFLFQGDHLILISEYSRRFFLETAGRFFPGYAERTTVIYNGLDWKHFKPAKPDSIRQIIPLEPGAQPVILHPHRPEESKGIRQTVAVADLLVHRYGLADLKVLVPQWLQAGLTADLRVFYDDIQRDIHERGLTEHFVFHGWIPQRLMPEYYALGNVTLSLGSFVESFGNSVYESLGCGTPAVVSRISSHRELLSEDLIDKVDFGDVEQAAALAVDIIRAGRRTSPATLDYLKTHYSVERQRAAYADVILNAQRRGPLRYQLRPIDETTCFKLPVWCYRSTSRGIYHDFQRKFWQDVQFDALIDEHPQGFTFAQAAGQGVTRAQVLDWYAMGYLVPV